MSAATITPDALAGHLATLRDPDAVNQFIRQARMLASRQVEATPSADDHARAAVRNVLSGHRELLAQEHGDAVNAAVRDALAALDVKPATQDRRPLLAQRVSLGSLLRDGIPALTFLPTPSLGERLFYAESVWIVSGDPKSGKSWLMATAALDCVTAGRPVVYIDFENRSHRFARRLLQLDADPDAIDEHMHYIELPRDLSLDTLTDDMKAIAAELPGAFIVVDSLRGLMARLSPPGNPLDPNAAQDVEAVCAPLNAAAALGLTVGIIDHTNKAQGQGRGNGYSTSGSQAKEAAVDAVYLFTKQEDFNKSVEGTVKLAANRDRDGELDFERYWKAGGQGEQPFTLRAAASEDVGSMAQVKSAVFDFLADHEGESFTANQVHTAKAAKARKTEIVKALELLAAGANHVHKDPNPRRKDSFVFGYDGTRDPSDAGGVEL